MLEVNPVMALINTPNPVPSTVLLFVVVGFEAVLQHTPRAVTGELPMLVTFPPVVALVAAIALAAVVVTVGIVPNVVKVKSVP